MKPKLHQTKLLLKHKKDIIKFCRTYESLCVPRNIKITIPKARFKVKITWDSDDKISIYDDEYIPDSMEFFYNSLEINKINKDIKKFIENTEKWGKTHFKNKDWLWENVLWNYRPESDEVFDEKHVCWAKE